MSLERYRQFLDRVESSPGYRHEVAVVEFTEDLCRLMDEQKVTRAELARRMGTSRAYITRLLGGNANYTLATALEGALHVHIADQRAVTRWHDEIPGQPPSSGESVPRRSRKSSAE